MHLRDPKNNYSTGLRDTAIACCVMRDDFREALTNSKNLLFAVGYCAYGIRLRNALKGISEAMFSNVLCATPSFGPVELHQPLWIMSYHTSRHDGMMTPCMAFLLMHWSFEEDRLTEGRSKVGNWKCQRART
jgi:hypothetical protein